MKTLNLEKGRKKIISGMYVNDEQQNQKLLMILFIMKTLSFDT